MPPLRLELPVHDFERVFRVSVLWVTNWAVKTRFVIQKKQARTAGLAFQPAVPFG